MSDREEQLAARLGAPLASERAATDRNWRAVRAGMETPVRPRLRGVFGAAATVALAALVLVAVGWWQGARVDVAGDRLPVLYRQEVARTAIVAAGIEASLTIEQKHLDSGTRLRVVGVTDVRLGPERLPAVIELRFARPGDESYGLLARSELSDPRRATGTTRTLYEAPFPPSADHDPSTYRVWLHIETASGTVESPVVVVRLADRPEGQRAEASGAQ
ncbi:MAG: hypothetical protein M3O64_06650 [Chloroflexota bacterium]|nr:hypothetical protein [Chloroflexota bacterium]